MIHVEGMTTKKILLVDDEPEIRELLQTVLEKEGFTSIYSAGTGIDAIEYCRELEPDVIVLDIMLPDLDGFEVCRKIREFSYAPIIFLSARSEDMDKLLGLGIGGDDYVTKPFSPKEVVFRIKAQFRRNQYLGQMEKKDQTERISFGDITLDVKRGEVIKSGELVNLTAKEYQLLLYLATNLNQILSKRKICERVWGYDYLGDDNTIMVHIRNLRKKIEDEPGSPHYLKTIKGLGYKLSTRGD